jgi:hypothetical protein
MATANRSGGGGETTREVRAAWGPRPGDEDDNDNDATSEAEAAASPWERMLEALDADDGDAPHQVARQRPRRR